MKFQTTSALLGLALLAPASGDAQTILETIDGLLVDDAYASSVANAFDVDGDGHDDVITGAWRFTNEGGRVEIRSGRTGALLRSWTGASGSGARYGYEVAGIGDVDGDGRSEVAFTIGREVTGLDNNFVSVRRGSDGSELLLIAGHGSELFGRSLAGGGDSDGDGIPELLIGVPAAGPNGELVHVDFSTPTPTLSVWSSPLVGSLGYHLAWVGDLDGDGADEFAGPTGAASSTITVFHAGAQHFWGRTVSGHSGYGEAIVNVGDVSFDGLPDLAIGAPNSNSPTSGTNTGYVELLSGLNGSFLRSREGNASGDEFGTTLGALGDVDGDGLGDLVVGAPYDGTPSFGVGFLKPGEVHVLSGFDLSTIDTQRGVGNRGYLGQSLATLSDVDGDGAREFVAGAPFSDVGLTDEPGTLWFFDPADHRARCQSFGIGTPGTLGTPVLSCVGAPLLGSSMSLQLTNSAGQPAFAALFAGRVDVVAPFFGGTLYVAPTIFEWIPAHPAAGSSIPLVVPQDHSYAGSRWVVQGLHLDAGAPQGVAFSNAISLQYGGG